MVSFNYFTILDPMFVQDLIKFGIVVAGFGFIIGAVLAWWFGDRFTVEIRIRRREQ